MLKDLRRRILVEDVSRLSGCKTVSRLSDELSEPLSGDDLNVF